MMHNAAHVLAPWATYAVLTGSAAASLTGLMFVVLTLISGERMRRNPDGISTFSTPTVVHFGAVLLVAGILTAPWHVLLFPAALLALCGLCGVVYALYLIHRTRQLRTASDYTPDAEDWIWYTALPLLSYAAILAGAIALFSIPLYALFGVGTGVMVLIFIGIHNAWDIVTFVSTGAGDDGGA
jgi:hypothetical protein